MELSKQLKAQGWYLTDDGIKTLSTAIGGDLEARKIIDEALNRDLRDIGGGALATNREESSATLGGRIVLQVQKVRNIAAPKSNEESKAAPRLLQLELSDGQQTLQALELEPVPALSLNVAPGTKIFFKAEKLQLMHGFLLLRQNELQLLGGRVEALYEKWDFARTMLKYARSGRPLTGATAPPPWVAFGKSINANDDRNFKSLVPAGDKDKPAKENDEFNATRNEAIAAASKVAVKKVFGGGGQNLVDYNIKKILDKGYSKEEAKLALQGTRNNLERALYNLKRRKDAAASGSTEAAPMRGGRGERPGREGKRGASLKDEAEAAKPAANATLFDFLTTKLPPTKDAEKLEASAMEAAVKASLATANAERTQSKHHEQNHEHKFQGTNDRSRFENNVSSSFAAHRGGPAGRVPRGGARNRPERGGGNFSSRAGGGGGGAPTAPGAGNGSSSNMRSRYENNSRATEQTHVKSAGRNGHELPREVSSKAVVSEAKQEQELTTGTKEQSNNNRRNNERQTNRNGNYRAENGNRNNSRRQPGAGSNGGGTVAPVGRVSNNPFSNNEDANTRLNKVVEETANLKINSTKREPRRGGKQSAGPSHRQQQFEAPANALPLEKKSTEKPIPGGATAAAAASTTAPQRQLPQPVKEHPRSQHQSNASYSQLPNGYTYDPSKIMGFQSKETNEFAMSLLKSQGLTIAPQAAAASAAQPPPSSQKLPTQATSPPAPMANNNSIKPRNTFDALPMASANSIQLPSNPQPAVLSSPPQYFTDDAWMWKAGDLCMAKYWDDGRYYEAEITGVSENTCVVFFLGYGNHEEVLKSDMLPLTDAQNRPLSNMPQSQHQHPKSRYRGDRQTQQQQVYVPPHKREY
ncbi:tudor domain-containing protein 3 [Drosophila albomicans]|uniref:Survival of motor neuron-related-splicing factor 30 n=1 Tax=Drosophila albomicans TaxID=7291 RepID=A0A6P8Y2K8_DROAB|nr:tudor domain-containing protein 3 [Drosophila albomicans]